MFGLDKYSLFTHVCEHMQNMITSHRDNILEFKISPDLTADTTIHILTFYLAWYLFVLFSLERARSNRLLVQEKLKLMATVHQSQPMIQLLLSTPDYVAALDLISTTQEILLQELNGIHSFRYIEILEKLFLRFIICLQFLLIKNLLKHWLLYVYIT